MKCTLLFLSAILYLLLPGSLHTQEMDLQYVSSHFTDVFDEGAAETIAYDAGTARIFFSNADANSVGILDISDPFLPTLITEISLDAYGGGVNSVDVYNGLLAVAVENEVKTLPGRVVFFQSDGTYLNDVEVGFLPDMLTFSPDGARVVVANEGEPDANYLEDPEGSVSIIDLSEGAVAATVQTARFSGFNDAKASLINRGIRIFGPGATVAQDLEPEYVAVSPDNIRAYVSCQENNAIAVVDLASAEVIDLYPMGTKDHRRGTPSVEESLINEIEGWPALGTPIYYGGQPPVSLGGFSGLYLDPGESDDGNYIFYTVPDRGPTAEAVDKAHVVGLGDFPAPVDLRPFKLPNYQARILKLQMNRNTGIVSLADSIMLRRYREDNTDTVGISGRSNVTFFDEIPVTYTDPETIYNSQDWVDTLNDVTYTELGHDAYGGDFEGVVRDRDGNFWLCDEYRPSLFKFAPNGVLIDRYVPEGASELAGDFLPVPAGSFGQEIFPEVYNTRRTNRGFEAVAYDPEAHLIYAFMQSPLDNPGPEIRPSDVIRILEVDAEDGSPVGEYVYLLERNRMNGNAISPVDKIGDAVFLGDGRFMVLEQDSSTPDDGPLGKKYIFEINLLGATNILGTSLSEKMTSGGPDDKTLEMMTADELVAAGITPVHKIKMLNLPSVGYLPGDKLEGLAQLPDGGLAVINDNDFGPAGAGFSEDISLGILTFDGNYGFDGSDRDDAINITSHPVQGMYQPDAIAAFEAEGQTYLLTANEGDSREYEGSPGLVEEADVGDIILNNIFFPDAATLQGEDQLGRYKITTENGDIDGDGLYDILYGFGGRSFSVLDTLGNLVYDSGDALEQITAMELPDQFNSNNDDNDSFDNRSDNKGPEPEAVIVGEINGMLYAFVGLERIGGVVVFRLADPAAPEFVQYINNRNFGVPADSRESGDLGVEDIVFIPLEESPVDRPLLVTSNEVSGTVSIFSVGELTDLEEVAQNYQPWRIYPNPAGEQLLSNQVSDYEVYTTVGTKVRIATGTNRVDLNGLPAGTYIVRDVSRNRSKLFIKQ